MVRKLGCQDVLVYLKTSPQAYKKWPQLPDRVEARLLTRTINGKDQQVLTSMVDSMRFLSADIAEIYSHRWKIELGYREMKNSLQQHRLTLRNKKAASLKGDMASQLSFHMASVYLIQELHAVSVTGDDPEADCGAGKTGDAVCAAGGVVAQIDAA